MQMETSQLSPFPGTQGLLCPVVLCKALPSLSHVVNKGVEEACRILSINVESRLWERISWNPVQATAEVSCGNEQGGQKHCPLPNAEQICGAA